MFWGGRTLPPIDMEPDRNVLEDHFPFECSLYRDPLSGSVLIGGRVTIFQERRITWSLQKQGGLVLYGRAAGGLNLYTWVYIEGKGNVASALANPWPSGVACCEWRAHAALGNLESQIYRPHAFEWWLACLFFERTLFGVRVKEDQPENHHFGGSAKRKLPRFMEVDFLLVPVLAGAVGKECPSPSESGCWE